MADDAIRKELDALKADMAQLRTDITGLTSALRGVASEKVANTTAGAQQHAQGAWEDIERKLDELLTDGRETADEVGEKMAQHPAGSLLAAFGVGFIIAKLMDIGGRR